MSVLLGNSGASVILGSSGGGVVRRASTAKTALASTDFTYLGRFQPPSSGGGTWWNYRGLTHRYVGAELRIMSLFHDGDATADANYVIREFTVPTLQTYPSKTDATVATSWTFPTAVSSLSNASEITGIYWDETDQRLYWARQTGDRSYYNAQNEAVVGYSTMSAGALSGTGLCSMGTAVGSKISFAFTPVPSWFMTATGLSTQRISTGFGGYRSVLGTGPASLGPALVAFTPPAATSGDLSGVTKLVQFSDTVRATRDDDYYSSNVSNPSGGVGGWTWSDLAYQAGCWIDTTTKSGFVVFPIMASIGSGNDGIQYIESYTSTSLTTVSAIVGLTVGERIGFDNAAGSNGWMIVGSITNAGRTITGSSWSATPDVSTPTVGGYVVRGEFYANSDLYSSKTKHQAYVIDPNDLVNVVGGSVQPDAVTPSSYWDITYPDTTDQVTGVTFDATTRRLYVLLGGTNRTVEVYEIAE